MSTTITKRSYAQALEDATAFYRLFPRECFVRWTGAGSLRRKRPEVGDVEHVVIPAFGQLQSDDLFGTPTTVNLLWHHLDALLAGGQVRKAWYGNGYRWGEKYRGVEFRGFTHEIFTADADNFGSVLAIRTGPGEYSKRLVLALQYNGYCNSGGYVRNKNDITCSGCGWKGNWAGVKWVHPEEAARGLTSPPPTPPAFMNGNEQGGFCPRCGRGGGLSLAMVPAPDEETYFRLCGLPWVEPESRFGA